MRNAMLNKMMNFVNNGSYSSDDLDKIRYGFEAIYILITKGIVIFTISYLLGIIKYTTCFALAYGLIRSFACGLHATSSLICLITSTIIFILIPYGCKTLVISSYVRISIMILSTILIYIYSPADTKKRPIINKNKRKKLKLVSTIISVIYILLSFIVKNSSLLNILCFSTLLEAILILPVTYKIFKLPYNNYINYLNSLN